jgi:hypothetical protein
MAKFTLGLPYPRIISLGTHSKGELAGPRTALDVLLPLPGIEPRFVQPDTFSVVDIPLHSEFCQQDKKAAYPPLYRLVDTVYTVYTVYTWCV